MEEEERGGLVLNTLLAIDRGYQFSTSPAVAELTQEDALPGAQVEAAVGDGNGDGGPDHGRFDVGGHVVGAFDGVPEEGHILRYDVVEDALEVRPYVGVGIFVDRQAGGSMFDEKVQDTPDRKAFRQLGQHLLGNDVIAPGVGRKAEFFL